MFQCLGSLSNERDSIPLTTDSYGLMKGRFLLVEMIHFGSEELSVAPCCAEGVLRLVGTNLLADERDGSAASVEIVG